MEFHDLKKYKAEFALIEEFRLGGKFICENSIDMNVQKAYKLIALNKSLIKEFYRILGYELIFDTGFCYFTEETKDDIETITYSRQFLDSFVDYIDIHKFLKTLDNGLVSQNNYTFNISTLEERLNKDVDLKATVEKMTFIKKRSTYREFLDSLLNKLKHDGFVESFNHKEGTYRLLKSYKYIEDIIEGIVEDD